MVSVANIRSLVSSYVVRSIDLAAFAEEFAMLFYDIEDHGDKEAIDLSYRIESELAKHAEGLFDERVLRNSLISCLQVPTFQQPIFSQNVIPTPEVTFAASGNVLASKFYEPEPIYAIA